MKDDDLDELRGLIKEKDDLIVNLLNERAALSQKVGRTKARRGVGVYDPSREAQVLRHICEGNRGPLTDEMLKDIYREILSASRSLQADLSVACLGPAGSFSHLAVRAAFGEGVNVHFVSTIGLVFDEAEKGKADLCVVPLENSLEGSVKVTLDRLVTTAMAIKAEVYLPVSHCLVSAGVPLEGIRRVYSHPQALGQCRRWLERHLPLAALVEMESTGAAVERAGQEEAAAAIGSRMAAELHGLELVAEAIEDLPHNTTRFLVMGKGLSPPSGQDKTSLLFSTAHVPGALHGALGPFAAAGVNLLRIESHPLREKKWEYLFFIDLDGHAEEEPLRSCLSAVRKRTSLLKVLGSYPRGEESP